MDQALLQQLITRLRMTGQEFQTLDAKQELTLHESGDKAEFVKDVVAMANNGEPSYIVVGLVDKTFEPVGKLTYHYDKNTRNQLLVDKIDPPIVVDYREFTFEGVEFGIVQIEGNNPPYVVARDIVPNRTDRKRSRVNKGTIFVRHEDRTEGISRSELEALLRKKQPKTQISFERDRSGTRKLKTRISLLCYLNTDGPGMAKEVSLWLRFTGCELFECPQEKHGHLADHFGNSDTKSSLIIHIPYLYARSTSQPIRFTLALQRVKTRSIHVVVKGENVEERGCVISVDEIGEEPTWQSVGLPVYYGTN